MINGISALQTNVIATVKRDGQRDVATNASFSQQANQQQAPVLFDPALPQTAENKPLWDQVSELMQVAQAAAAASAGIEPQASTATRFGRAIEAYACADAYRAAPGLGLLSLAI